MGPCLEPRCCTPLATHNEARLEQRQVERPAVEGDDAGKFGDALGHVCHHRSLFAERAHEVLLDDEPLTLEEA